MAVDPTLIYGTAAGFTAYAVQRDYTVPTAQTDDIEAALLVASEWLDGTYRPVFMAVPKGSLLRYGATINSDIGTYKTGMRAQVREWPRVGFVDSYGYPIASNEIPREIQNATYEAAFRQLTAPGSLRVDVTISKYSQVAIDGAISVTYAGNSLSAADQQPVIPIIDAILAGLLGSVEGSQMSSLSGAANRM